MRGKPLLSICIPTYNRAEYLKKMLKSIVISGAFTRGEVEIVVSDNCSTDDTEVICKSFAKTKYENFHYFRNSENIVDRNFPTVLSRARGVYRKLCNDTFLFAPDSLDRMLDIIRENIDNRPVLYFMNGIRKGNFAVTSLEEFLNKVSFYVTWIGGFGVWEEDAIGIEDTAEWCGKQLWQVPFLLNNVVCKNKAFVIGTAYWSMQTVHGKNLTYGLYKVFYENYLDFLKQYVSDGRLSIACFEWLEKDLLFGFFMQWLYEYESKNDLFRFAADENLTDLVLRAYRAKTYYRSFTRRYSLYRVARFVWASKKNAIVLWKVFLSRLFPYRLKLHLFNRKWRRRNRHNRTSIAGYCDLRKVIVGRETYGCIKVTDCSPLDTRLVIGSYCSVAPNVRFLLGGEHQLASVSTYPFRVMRFGEAREAGSKGDITVGDDVWIGDGAIVCSGVSIGQGAVVAAGAVVTKDVEPYAIVGGNPARLIKWRFGEALRRRMCEMDVAALFDSFGKGDMPLVYADLTEDVLNEIFEEHNG